MKRSVLTAAIVLAISTAAYAEVWHNADVPVAKICKLVHIMPQTNNRHVPPTIELTVARQAFLLQIFEPHGWFGPADRPVSATIRIDDTRLFGQGFAHYYSGGLHGVDFPVDVKFVDRFISKVFDAKTLSIELEDGRVLSAPAPGADKVDQNRMDSFIDCANSLGGVTHTYGKR